MLVMHWEEALRTLCSRIANLNVVVLYRSKNRERHCERMITSWSFHQHSWAKLVQWWKQEINTAMFSLILFLLNYAISCKHFIFVAKENVWYTSECQWYKLVFVECNVSSHPCACESFTIPLFSIQCVEYESIRVLLNGKHCWRGFESMCRPMVAHGVFFKPTSLIQSLPFPCVDRHKRQNSYASKYTLEACLCK